MTEFDKKYWKGATLFILLSLYELPILLNYLCFGRKDWVTGHSSPPLGERGDGSEGAEIPEPLTPAPLP
jgi:hypothetical protein